MQEGELETEHKPGHRTGRGCGVGAAMIWLGEGLDSEAPKIELPSLQAHDLRPPRHPHLSGPYTTCLCPGSFVRTAPPHSTPTPALGTQGILAMCPVLVLEGKKQNKRGEALSLGLCLCRTSHSPLVLLSPRRWPSRVSIWLDISKPTGTLVACIPSSNHKAASAISANPCPFPLS